MGRSETSSAPLAPQAYRKEQRAKYARLTINKTIPALLASDARARTGIERAELIIDPQPITRKPSPMLANEPHIAGKGARKRKEKGKVVLGDEDMPPKRPQSGAVRSETSQQDDTPVRLKISVSDTLAAAHELHKSSPKHGKNVAVLNMASPLRPGGGVLNGATSQEESLSIRTTLLPSLKEEWYRLPEIGAAWSPDVCVFRLPNAVAGEDEELTKGKRFYVDVVSAAMLRFPDVISSVRKRGEPGGNEEGDEETKSVYANEKDREMVLNKIRAVVRILQAKEAESAVLGAWGCGAYGNPVGEVVQAWKKVLLGSSRKSKGRGQSTDWSPLKEVVFAIKDRKVAEDFASAWGENVVFENKHVSRISPEQSGTRDDIDRRNIEELEMKVRELKIQIPQVKTPLLRKGLEDALQALRVQLVGYEDSEAGPPQLPNAEQHEDRDAQSENEE